LNTIHIQFDYKIINMNILVVGDIHIKPSNHKDIHKLHDLICKVIETSKIGMVVLLGDTLDRFNDIKCTSQCLALDMIKAYASKVPTFVLIGNHDRINNKDNCSDISPFKAWSLFPPKNIYVVDKPYVYDKYLFMPYVPNGKFNDTIKDKGLDPKSFKLVFAHQEFQGCEYNHITSKDGDTWDPAYPLVISGHIHKKQRVGDNIYYTGSALQHSIDEDTEKYLHIFSVANSIQIKTVKVPIYPKIKLKFKLPLPDNILELVANKRVTLEVTGTPPQIETFESSDIYTQLRANKDVRIIPIRTYDIKQVDNRVRFIDIFMAKLTDEEKEVFNLLVKEDGVDIGVEGS